MAVIITDMDKPKNCEECPFSNLSQDNCSLLWIDSIRYNSTDCPLKSADEMIKEISICKTENEMRIAERDYKSRLWISGIFSEVVGIIHKYCDKEQNNDGQDG